MNPMIHMKDNLKHQTSAFTRACMLLVVVPMLISQGAAANDNQDQWREEILLQLSELRKAQGVLKRELSEVKSGLQTLKSAIQTTSTLTLDLDGDDYPVIGKSTARVAIVEFSDFECPFCRKHQKETLPALVKRYIDQGKLKYVFLDYPLGFHANAKSAAIAARCARQQDAFMPMREKMFEHQNALTEPTFLSLAGEIGLDTGKFGDCLRDPAVSEHIQAQVQLGEAAGVQGTPAFVIGRIEHGMLADVRMITGAQPIANFERILGEYLSNRNPVN